MELKKVLAGLEGLKAKGELDLDIKSLESYSRTIMKNSMFVAIKGFDADGNDYIKDAIENGAIAVMVQQGTDLRKVKVPEGVTLIVAPDTRYSLAIAASNFYKNPAKKLRLVGITGTKGKTTTSFMIKSILEKQGKKVGLIGTIATYIGEEKLKDSERTTPDSLELQKIFAEMVKQKVEVVVMEVSSQSLKLDRVAGLEFEVGVFTNFLRDHISPKEHPDMEDYFNSKVKLFNMCKKAYINADDLHVQKLKKMELPCEIKTFGIDNPCNILAKDITVTSSTVDFKVKIGEKNERIKTDIPGRFSVYNSLAAVCVGMEFGCDAENIKEALLNVKVPGRSELVENEKGLTIMIDYAHSPESLESILTALKGYTRGRLISVFGCGGDRDSTKRPIMGEISGKIADFTIITSDNPRTEDPNKIIKSIETGIKKTKGKYVCIENRRDAIKEAIKMANKNDVIVLAGKGHEPYQEINGEKYDFDERVIVKEIIEEL